MLDSLSTPASPSMHCTRLSKGEGITKKREKRVRFSGQVDVRHLEEYVGNEEVNPDNAAAADSSSSSRNNSNNSIWWSPDEMTELRHAAKVSSREVSRNLWMVDAFEDAYRIARQLAATNDDRSALSEILDDPLPHMSQELISWCRYGHSRRGLERWSSKFHNASRSETVKRARRKVVEDIKEADPESVRLMYERMGRSSKIFARFMGQADAAALEPVVVESKRSSSNCCEHSSVPALTTSTTLDGTISCRLRINRQ